MKKIRFSIIVFCLSLAGLCLQSAAQSGSGTTEWSELKPQPIQSSVEEFAGKLLSSAHYKKRVIDDALSSEMFDSYLDRLDNGKFYFLQSDIDDFEKYRFQFDDAINSGDLTGAFFIYNRLQQRIRSRLEYIHNLFDKDYDFTLDEYFDTDREDKSWAKTESELEELWGKRIKNEVLSLKIAGKETADIAETLRKRYQTILRNIDQTGSEDIFNLYMNAFAEMFDPHTGYMSPQMSDNFRIQISKSLEGIGAQLQTEDEYTKVVEIVPGGPADKSDLLHPNDRIVGVGQGDDGEMVDVIGWRLDDVVQLIRGPKDSKVRLQIIPADAPVYGDYKVIEIIRDKVTLSDRMAKSTVHEIEYRGKNFKIGVIEIPDFYFDYESQQNGDPDYPSTTRDVQKLLAELNAASVDGIVIDLRQNGGGFLSEAIGLTGLFIKNGPVVQVRDSRGRITEQIDRDSNVYYDGPLAVLVDRLSASASEIFAAAIQDYGRGIIVGSPTFGKGTVQSIVSLDDYIDSGNERVGQIRLTVAKFYRINGSSTQHLGVTPDFQFPSRYQAMEIGESNYDHALRWDQIGGTDFTPSNDPIRNLIPDLVQRFDSRMKDSTEYQYLTEDIKQIVEQRENTRVSLNEEKRIAERDVADLRAKQREEELHKDSEDTDLFLGETEHILGDYLLMIHPGTMLATP